MGALPGSPATRRSAKRRGPRAIASATPGAMWSSCVRSSTVTLEISTAIAGAAVVRTAARWPSAPRAGDPLNRCASSACTGRPAFGSAKQTGLRAIPRNQPRRVTPTLNHSSRKRAPSPARPSTQCAARQKSPALRIGHRERSSNDGFAFPCASAPPEILCLQRRAHLRANSSTMSLS